MEALKFKDKFSCSSVYINNIKYSTSVSEDNFADKSLGNGLCFISEFKLWYGK